MYIYHLQEEFFKIISDFFYVLDIIVELLNTSISGDEGESLTICLSLTNGILLYPLEVNVSGSSKFYSLFIEYLNLRKMCDRSNPSNM